jgi:hypothetical protein
MVIQTPFSVTGGGIYSRRRDSAHVANECRVIICAYGWLSAVYI